MTNCGDSALLRASSAKPPWGSGRAEAMSLCFPTEQIYHRDGFVLASIKPVSKPGLRFISRIEGYDLEAIGKACENGEHEGQCYECLPNTSRLAAESPVRHRGRHGDVPHPVLTIPRHQSFNQRKDSSLTPLPPSLMNIRKIGEIPGPTQLGLARQWLVRAQCQ